jgi:hypothetical protein
MAPLLVSPKNRKWTPGGQSVTPLAGRQTTSGIIEGGTPSTDTLMVCPPGDTTSTEVGLGPKIDLAAIFFVEEEKRRRNRKFPLCSGLSSQSIGSLSTTIPLFFVEAFRFRLLTAGAGEVRPHKGNLKGSEARFPDPD